MKRQWSWGSTVSCGPPSHTGGETKRPLVLSSGIWSAWSGWAVQVGTGSSLGGEKGHLEQCKTSRKLGSCCLRGYNHPICAVCPRLLKALPAPGQVLSLVVWMLSVYEHRLHRLQTLAATSLVSPTERELSVQISSLVHLCLSQG